MHVNAKLRRWPCAGGAHHGGVECVMCANLQISGAAVSLCQEGLFSFEFPEKPGALMRFLEQLPPGDGYGLSDKSSLNSSRDIADTFQVQQVLAEPV